MNILVDGEIKTLKALDNNGFEWTLDLLGNEPSPSYRYDEDKEMYVLSADDYEWWSGIIDKLNKIAVMISNLTNEEFKEYQSENFIGDLESTVDAQLNWLIEREAAAHSSVSLILHDFQTAQSLGEDGVNAFRKSREENRLCAKAVIAAKKDNTTYGEMAGTCYFEAAKTVEDVLALGYSLERLGYVIASNVIRYPDTLDNPRLIDGRFSNRVKEWAIELISKQENFPFRSFEDCDLTAAMHHTLVNSLAEKFIDKQLELSRFEKFCEETTRKVDALEGGASCFILDFPCEGMKIGFEKDAALYKHSNVVSLHFEYKGRHIADSYYETTECLPYVLRDIKEDMYLNLRNESRTLGELIAHYDESAKNLHSKAKSKDDRQQDVAR